MAKSKKQDEKPKGLSDAELVAKYEAGEQNVGVIIEMMLSQPAPNAPAKIKRDYSQLDEPQAEL